MMEGQFHGKERRRVKRVRVSLSLIYKVHEPLTVSLLTAEKEIKAHILDLSQEGMAISTDYHLPQDTVLIMRFTLYRVDRDDISFYGPVEIEGVVRYNVKENETSRLGIRFTKIEEQDKREITNFANMALRLLNNT
jgi:c-di-GMP-binding flagellar brake protein YcgR